MRDRVSVIIEAIAKQGFEFVAALGGTKRVRQTAPVTLDRLDTLKTALLFWRYAGALLPKGVVVNHRRIDVCAKRALNHKTTS